ncbi:MAG: DUF4838 domain-containing protein [Verrucomicrobiae bacterium]|nr:DUF4838 domain-containing protein [Verrucomicrobiae bacterium]
MKGNFFSRLAGAIASLTALWMSIHDGLSDDLTLVRNGVSEAPIVVFENAPPFTREAADTLADYVEKVGDARPEILEGTPNPLPEHAIWVGYQPVLKKLFPDTNFDFTHPEEILIAANENHLVIAGRDRWDPDRLVVEGIDEKIEGRQLEYGTVNAVYTFLQDQLGVRWLWPGELGEDLEKRDTISFAPFEYRFHPRIRSRGGVFNFSSLGNKGYGRAHDWTRKQRLQLDSLEMGGGHGFGDWWERYHEKYPEIFALQPDGTRSGFPNPRTAKLCESNPKVWELWLKDVAEQLAVDPNQRVFNASPNDGWASGHCVCEQCSAWDHPNGEPRLFHWKGVHEERPALSDRDVTFANRLGALLSERYPDKDYYVLMMSYGHSRPVPVKARPADNVIISSVANFLGRTGLVDRGSTRGDTYREQFDGWGRISPHLMWRPNTGSPAGWQQGLPDLTTTQTIADIKAVANAHCVGIYIDSVWEHWATQGPQYYLMAQTVWNPDADPDAILGDYYQRGFGPSSEEIRSYFEKLEKARSAYVSEYGLETDPRNFSRLYSPELLGTCRELLDRAAANAGNQGEGIYAKRVAFVTTGLEHSRLLMEIARRMKTYWQKPDETLRSEVEALWRDVEANASGDPYAINWGPVRPTTDRMAGLHPDHPNRKWKKNPKGPDDLDQN